jgi:hypothetical protein
MAGSPPSLWCCTPALPELPIGQSSREAIVAARKKRGGEPPEEVEFRFCRSAGYRVHPADGAWGGLTPTGDVAVCFYIDQQPTPSTVRHALKKDGTLGDEISRDPPKDAQMIIRELQTGVVLTLEKAEVLADWLKARVDQGRRLRGERPGD